MVKQRVELNRVREFGDVINDTILFFKQNFRPLMNAYFVICGFFLVAGAAIQIVVELRDLQDNNLTPFNLSYWTNLLFSSLDSAVVALTTLSYIALYKEKGKEPPTVTEVWGYFRYYFFRVFISQLILEACVVVGFFLCIFPGVYLLPVLSLVIPIMVLENTSLNYAFSYCFKLIKENWWFMLGVILLLFIIVFAAMALVIVPPLVIIGGGEWLSGINSNSTEIIASAIASNLARVFYILPIIAIALVYFSLAEQIHATSLMQRIQMFGKKDTRDDQTSSEQY